MYKQLKVAHFQAHKLSNSGGFCEFEFNHKYVRVRFSADVLILIFLILDFFFGFILVSSLGFIILGRLLSFVT